ncbi:MAG: CcmD family protein [Anaerolineae bacterium]|nr:CcmD family protein [Anaerolineae bacterium]
MMGNLAYLVAAYAVFWAVTFVFLLRMSRRQRALQSEIESLRRTLETSQDRM